MIDESIYAPHNACVFDIETTYGKYLARAGSPFSDGEIGICAAGFRFASDYRDVYFVKPDQNGFRKGVQKGSQEWYDSFPDLSGVQVLVGHNIKFDLLWYWRHPRLEAFLKAGGRIWDTLYAEYLLSGQFYRLDQLPHLIPSLSNVAKRRGCTHKIDVVAALWDKGIRTEDIQEQVLMEYQKGDCQTTFEVYTDQVAQAVRQNQLHMIHYRMDGLLATTEMEYNGLVIDLNEAEAQMEILNAELEKMAEALNQYLPTDLPDELKFNWGSTGQLSALIFGGSIKYKGRRMKVDDNGNPVYYKISVRKQVLDDDGNPVRFKGGKNKGKIKTRMETVDDIERGPKTRLEDCFHTLPGFVAGKPKWRTDASKDETRSDFIRYSTSSDILEEVAKLGVELVSYLLAKRGVEKDLGTYYKRFHRGKWTGMLTMVHPDNRIHHNLNHASTKTSRLSSSKPNLQNLSGTGKSNVRKVFISRFGPDGLVVEGDYSQLEVVCKGVLSGDKALLQALIDGVCFHCDWLSLTPEGAKIGYDEVYRLCKVDHDPAWVDKRKGIKPLTFGEAYGAGVPKMSEDTGLDAAIIEAAIKNRKLKYPDMYRFDDDNMAKVQSSRRLSSVTTEGGFQAGIGYLRIVTDTVFHFMETDAPDWKQRQGEMTAFSPTTIKNYPSQGLGGEIMQVQAGRVFRWLLENDRFGDRMLMTNTVHDCMWLDCHKEVAKHIAKVKEIMEDVCDFFNAHYRNINWNTPFPTEWEAGPNMYELEHMHFEEAV